MNTQPNYSFQLPRGLLRAISLFQSKDAYRGALVTTQFRVFRNGVRHSAQLAAVDGRRLATCEVEVMSDSLFGEMPATDEMLLDLEPVRRLPKASPDVVTIEVYAKHVEFVSGVIRYAAKRVELGDLGLKFPDWRVIIPQQKAEVKDTFAINAELFADFGKAAKLISRDSVLHLRGYAGDTGPITVQMPGERGFFGIIMPVRFEESPECPDWLKVAPEVERSDDEGSEEQAEGED